jgi:Tfp pilus assembly protein FimT
MIEILAVSAIVGIISAISYPKISSMRESMAVHSARDQVAQYFAVARSAAIHRARNANVVVDGNRMSVTTVDAAGTTVMVAREAKLDSLYGVTLTATTNTITFDPRGMASGLGGMQKFVVTRSSVKDSVCVTRLGALLRNCGT